MTAVLSIILLRIVYLMQEKNHAGEEAIDSARDLAVLKLQDMYEVVTRDIMSDTMRYNSFSLDTIMLFVYTEDVVPQVYACS